jgi:hypothetical protein
MEKSGLRREWHLVRRIEQVENLALLTESRSGRHLRLV